MFRPKEGKVSKLFKCNITRQWKHVPFCHPAFGGWRFLVLHRRFGTVFHKNAETVKLLAVVKRILKVTHSTGIWTNQSLMQLRLLFWFWMLAQAKLFLTDPFRFCNIYLELSAWTHSPYQQTINLQKPTKISCIPVCFFRLVTWCQRLRFVLQFLTLHKFMYVYMRYKSDYW